MLNESAKKQSWNEHEGKRARSQNCERRISRSLMLAYFHQKVQGLAPTGKAGSSEI